MQYLLSQEELDKLRSNTPEKEIQDQVKFRVTALGAKLVQLMRDDGFTAYDGRLLTQIRHLFRDAHLPPVNPDAAVVADGKTNPSR